MVSLGWVGPEPAPCWDSRSSPLRSLTTLGTGFAHPNEAMNSIQKLPPMAAAALAAWVKAGAPWPDGRPAPAADDWKEHWAFRPVRRPPVPDVKGPDPSRNPIDRFLLA